MKKKSLKKLICRLPFSPFQKKIEIFDAVNGVRSKNMIAYKKKTLTHTHISKSKMMRKKRRKKLTFNEKNFLLKNMLGMIVLLVDWYLNINVYSIN